MKKSIPCVIALGLLTLPFSPAAQAQAPQLTAANTLPVSGNTVTPFTTTTFNPGGAGANQTWDFSTQNYTPADPYNYGNCSSAGADCSPFNGPTLVAFSNASGNNVSSYYKTSSSVFTTVGVKVISPQITYSNVYPKARDILRFPMNYNTAFTNPWSSTATIPGGIQLSGGGVDTISADAWGTVKTPAGSFRALRVRTSCKQYDTSKLNGTAGSVVITNFVSYVWYDAVNKGPIYTGVISSSTGGTPTTSGTYVKAIPAGISTMPNQAFSWTVAPNPATGNRIQVRMEGKNTVLVGLRLTDLLGRELRTLAPTNWSAGPLSLETAGLPAGTYILSVTVNGQPQGAQCVNLSE